MIRGVDYSFDRPTGAVIKGAGHEFVCRYVPYPGDGGKGLGANELVDLRANGLAVVLVFESTSGRMLEGKAAGVADATHSDHAAAVLGINGRPIYFACDFDAQLPEFNKLTEYMDGCESVLGRNRVGIYGSYKVVQAFADRYFLWQTYAWSGGQRYPGIHIYQYSNGETLNGAVDFNEAYGADYGQWPAPASEDDPMERFRLGLIAVASGDYVRMSECYDALAAAGFRPALPALPNDGGLGDLNAVEVRRWGIMELAASDAADQAYKAIGG